MYTIYVTFKCIEGKREAYIENSTRKESSMP